MSTKNILLKYGADFVSPLSNLLLPLISSNKLQTPTGKISFSNGGLLGTTDVASNYEEFINRKERERLLTPFAQKLSLLQSNLAKNIGLQMGMTPDQAVVASTKLSGPSIIAFGLLRANNTPQILAKFDEAMKKEGLISPFGLGGAKLTTQAYNERMQRTMDDMLNLVMNPISSSRFSGMSPQEIADIVIPKFSAGEYNNIFSNPASYDRTGHLTRQAAGKLFNEIENTTKTIREFQYMFPGDSPSQAYEKVTNFFGGDPIKKLGPARSAELFRNFRSTARAAGVKDEDAMNLLANIGSSFKASGRDPMNAILTAKDMMIMSAASRTGTTEGVDPGKYNQSLIGSIAASRQSPVSTLSSSMYAALASRVGEKDAGKIIAEVMADRNNIKDPKKFVERANALMLRYPGQTLAPVDITKLEAYSSDPLATKFRTSGLDSALILKHHGEQILDFRKDILKKRFNWSDEQVHMLDQMGGATMDNIKRFVANSTPADQPDLLKARVFEIEKKFGALAQNQGFDNAQSVDRFLHGIRDTGTLAKFKAASNRSDRVAKSLNSFPRTGGFKGLTQYLMGDKSQGNWWEAITGSRTLSPEEVGQLQGVDVRKLDNAMPGVWANTLSGWLRPEAATPEQRTQALSTMTKIPEKKA